MCESCNSFLQLYNRYEFKSAHLYSFFPVTENYFMTTYYYIFSIMLLTIIFILIRSFILRKKNAPVRLFNEALKNENSGHFEEAVITYETALKEINKIRFHGTLKNKIIDKIKVLRTILEYNNNVRFTRY